MPEKPVSIKQSALRATAIAAIALAAIAAFVSAASWVMFIGWPRLADAFGERTAALLVAGLFVFVFIWLVAFASMQAPGDY